MERTEKFDGLHEVNILPRRDGIVSLAVPELRGAEVVLAQDTSRGSRSAVGEAQCRMTAFPPAPPQPEKRSFFNWLAGPNPGFGYGSSFTDRVLITAVIGGWTPIIVSWAFIGGTVGLPLVIAMGVGIVALPLAVYVASSIARRIKWGPR